VHSQHENPEVLSRAAAALYLCAVNGAQALMWWWQIEAELLLVRRRAVRTGGQAA
jgi:hypothetical protein